MAQVGDFQPETESRGLLSRYHLLTLYLPAVILALGHGIATPALPVFTKSFGISFGVASLVIVVHTLGSLLSTVPTGFLLDRLGRRRILLFGPMLTGISSFLMATVQSFPELLFYRFIGGWAEQMWRQSRLAVIADTVNERRRGRQMTGMVGMESAGRLLGPAVGGLLAGRNIRVPFVVHGILSLAAILPSFWMVQESVPVSPQRQPSKADGPARAASGFWREILKFPYLAFFTAQFFASLARGSLWGGTLLLYVAYAYHAGPELLGGLSTVTGIIGIPITFSSGYMMDRFGRKTTIVPGFALTAAGLVFMALTAQWRLTLTAFIVAYVWVQGAQSLTSGNMQVLGADLAPASSRGKFFGVWRMIGEVGHLLSPAIFALLAEKIAYSLSFFFLAFCSFAAAAVVGLRVRETVGRGRI